MVIGSRVNPVGASLYVVFTFVQFSIARLLLGWAGHRFSGRARSAARTAIWAGSLLVVAAYLCTMSDLMARWHFPANAALLIGAADFAYFLVAAGVLAVFLVFRFARRRLDAPVDSGRRRLLNATGNVLMAGPFVLLGYGGLVQRTDFRVKEVDVPIDGLPADLDGLRLLQISDIHLSPFLSEAELARAIDTCLELRPHVALVTGDLISGRGDPLDACIRQLARVKADAGVFGCMGNHERYAGVEAVAAAESARIGIRFLRGHAQALRFGGATLNVAGVDYQSLAGKKTYLDGAEKLILPGAFNLLLSHNPDVFPVAARQGYNFMLAGHTHGGQVTVEILDQSINPARFITPYVYGLYREGKAAAYVTRGIGTIGIPARIGAPPEIALLRLRKA
jgi:uncharacterized protein